MSDAAGAPVPEVTVAQPAEAPRGAFWVPEGIDVPVAAVEVPAEFERDGQISADDYIVGLKAEYSTAAPENRAAIKAELDRVAGLRVGIQTATAPALGEIA